jgi:hypothetical protein
MIINRLHDLKRRVQACLELASEASEPRARLYYLTMADHWAAKARDGIADQDEPPPSVLVA